MLFEGFHKRSEKLLIVVIVMMLLSSFFVGIGESLMIEDECIRALVALEMQYQDDYITPTLGGDPYFKKPPLYNWILSAFTQLAGDYSALTLRIPNVIFLIGFAISIWYFVRKELGNRIGLFTALAFLTAGRIIFYESLFALIDILFSWLIFVEFMVIYFSYKKGKLKRLFILVYLITAIAFMLKSLPALVFTAISLVVFFAWKKKLRLLFSWNHILGICILIVILGSYYLAYFLRNDLDIEEFFLVMFTESSKRTTGNGIIKVLLHIVTYPMEFVGHFAPWTLLVGFFAFKRIRKITVKHDFLVFSLLMFISNIIIYWISPDVYPRYVLMLLPLLFIPLFYVYDKEVPWKKSGVGFLSLVLVICMLRMSYNFVIPIIAQTHHLKDRKEMALKIAQKTKGEKLYSYWSKSYPTTDYYGRRCVTYDIMYYLSLEKQDVFEITDEVEKDQLYLMKNYHFSDSLFIKLDTFDIFPEYEYYHILAIGK